MKFSRMDMFAIAVALGQAATALYVFRFGATGSFPIHFDYQGRPNGWGTRAEVGWIVLGLAALTLTLYALLPAVAHRTAKIPVSEMGLMAAQSLLLVVFILLTAEIAWLALGQAQGKTAADAPIMAFLASIMLVSGFWIGKVGPNPFVGIRTYWARRSRLAWDKSNRLFGRIALWSGAAGLVATPIAPQPLGIEVMSAVLLGATAVSVFESWRVWRSDPDRKTA